MASLLKLKAVPQNATIGIVAPASPAKPERVARGVAALQSLGFAIKPGPKALQRGPLYFAGSAADRLADLHAAFSDSATDAVMAIRGGYGSNYLLENLDLKAIADRAKPFFGYSDLTGVQLHLLDKIGLPAFHGPMLAADFFLEDGVHLESFRAALAGKTYTVGAAEGLRILKRIGSQNSVAGTLYGGCLSILVSLLGTPWEPATENKLLFIEDTGAKPYQIDRMLWQLRAAGKFAGITGIIFGEMLECNSPGAPPDLVDRAILSALDGLDVPIAVGLRSGHVSRQNVTLTFGVETELKLSEEPTLSILKPAVTA